MQLIPIRRKFVYEKLERIDAPMGRVYRVDGQDYDMPSVTRILSGTKDRTHLDSWAERVGWEKAEKIKNEAATVGTHMHNVVERLLLNRDLPAPRTWLQVRGYRMGYRLIEEFFPTSMKSGAQKPRCITRSGMQARPTAWVFTRARHPSLTSSKPTE
jgi:hypothetical protein